jgi:ergothioneine biosynthesis protein EgtB
MIAPQAMSPVTESGQPSLLEHYLKVRQMSLHLCSPLSVEDHSLQPMADASPAKWHLAHTTWFFETFLLSNYLEDYQPFNPAFRNFFNSYYNAIGDRPLRALRHILSRPSLEEIHAYREYVDHAMDHLLLCDPPEIARQLVMLGINHEQQHQELIVTDVKNGLWSNPLHPAYHNPEYAHLQRSESPVSALGWQSYSAGLHPVGFEGTGFSFDNEGPRHQVYLEAFRLASRLVTNGEYLAFMRDNGYGKPEFWLSDGWDAVRNNQWAAPFYWQQRDGEWWYYTIEGMQLLDENEPVCHVSFYEADAYARWAGARLPSEFEWEVAAGNVPIEGNLAGSGMLQPRPAAGNGKLSQMYGDVWEWTGSAYLSYPNFKPTAGAVGEYNGKFMCNQMVLRGGSCATPQSHIRPTYRNFFPPHVRWQFSGIRLANGD